MLAVDHGYFQGPTTGLESPERVIAPLLPHADALMATRGVVRTSVAPERCRSVVLRVSGGTSMAGEDLSDEGLIASVEDALRLDASAVAISIFVGTKHERQTLLNLAHLVDEGERCGLPVLAVTAVGKEIGKRDARHLALACRIAAEVGASIVKTYSCEGFERVVGGCPVPVVVAGGLKVPEREALELAGDAVRRGAAGVDMGRNIWQSAHPVPMIRAVRSIVHDGAAPERAFELFEELARGG